ncbi:hypothetical protein AYI68_g365 [Smittium mucronatum]|uniref:Reverse transcriptase domain-containing protein n=1 Tax=Smittium mucronatum TaxID=133383 RepID=A0A1R0H8K8_9FUNG|nr:hypothetical protein AYI68_g365 [Smittium mucronatum]
MWAATRLSSLTNTIRFLYYDFFKGIQGLYVPRFTSRIPGLLFADYAVVLDKSETDMQTALNKITDWLKTWEMTLNESKCRAMNAAGLQLSELILQGQNIPSTVQ